MTEDRDFKQHVRARAEKTGESYQAARRQLEQKRPHFVARVTSMFRVESGIAFGCLIDQGKVTRGMNVTVRLNDEVIHEGVVASLRHGQADIDSVAEGQFSAGFGMIVEPPTTGRTRRSHRVTGAFKPRRDNPASHLRGGDETGRAGSPDRRMTALVGKFVGPAVAVVRLRDIVEAHSSDGFGALEQRFGDSVHPVHHSVIGSEDDRVRKYSPLGSAGRVEHLPHGWSFGFVEPVNGASSPFSPGQK
jgi:hypothetical protein